MAESRQASAEQHKYIDVRWEQLYELSSKAGETAINYLFFVNSGGAVATLSFLGTSETVRQMVAPKISLGFFVAGLILVGVLRAIQLHSYERLFDTWRHNVVLFLEGKITWTELTKRDDARSKTNVWEYVIGYLGFLCAIVGAGIGLFRIIAP